MMLSVKKGFNSKFKNSGFHLLSIPVSVIEKKTSLLLLFTILLLKPIWGYMGDSLQD